MTAIVDASDLDGALEGMRGIEARARAGEHRWGLFAGVYAAVTRALRTSLAAGDFRDRADMERFVAVFANRYFRAFRRHQAGEVPPRCWRIAMNAATRADLTALQQVLLGINAHINLDLGLAVAESGVVLDEFRADFDQINVVLRRVLDRVQAVFNEFSPALAVVDRVLRRSDEILGMFALRRARANAWNAAVITVSLPEAARVVFEGTLDDATANLGRRIADPGPPVSAGVRLIAHYEQWRVGDVLDRLAAL